MVWCDCVGVGVVVGVRDTVRAGIANVDLRECHHHRFRNLIVIPYFISLSFDIFFFKKHFH